MNRTQSSYCYLRNRVTYFYTCSMNSVHISYLKNRDSLIVSINLNGLQIETNHPDTHFKNVERYKIYCHLKPMRKAHLIYSDIEIQLHSLKQKLIKCLDYTLQTRFVVLSQKNTLENDNIKIFLKNLQLKLNVRSARLCTE